MKLDWKNPIVLSVGTFIGLFVLSFIILWLLKPTFVTTIDKTTRRKIVNFTALVFSALIIGIVGAVVIFLFFGSKKKDKPMEYNYCPSCGSDISPHSPNRPRRKSSAHKPVTPPSPPSPVTPPSPPPSE